MYSRGKHPSTFRRNLKGGRYSTSLGKSVGGKLGLQRWRKFFFGHAGDGKNRGSLRFLALTGGEKKGKKKR